NATAVIGSMQRTDFTLCTLPPPLSLSLPRKGGGNVVALLCPISTASFASSLSYRLLLPDRRHVAATAIFRQRRQPPDRRPGALPGHRPLRRAAMPGPGIEIAELLVLHLIKLDI